MYLHTTYLNIIKNLGDNDALLPADVFFAKVLKLIFLYENFVE